jgi:hypothetical protein
VLKKSVDTAKSTMSGFDISLALTTLAFVAHCAVKAFEENNVKRIAKLRIIENLIVFDLIVK